METTVQDKFRKLVDWVNKNGGCFAFAKVPVKFEQGQIGIQALEDIPQKTAILFVPFTLIISVNKALSSQLKPFFNKHSKIFHPDCADDAQFNVLGVFLFYHFLKGQDSFYFPYLNTLPRQDFIAMSWTESQLQQLPSNIKSEIMYLKDQISQVIKNVLQIVHNQPLFQTLLTNKTQQQLSFLLGISLNLVMTRCFGYSLPSTSLVPLMDMLNHTDRQNTTHYLLNTKFQNNTQLETTYRRKKTKLNLQIMKYPKPQIVLSKSEKEKYLQQNEYEIKEMDNIDCQISKMNRQKLKRRHEDIHWDMSSDSQDNDSDQEVKEKRDELMRNLRKREIQSRGMYEKKMKQKQKEKQKEKSQEKNEEGFFSNHGTESSDESQDSSDLSDDQFEWCTSQTQNLVILTTTRDIKKGEQLYTSYGRRTNKFLLLWYGFCLEQNKYDSVPFRLKVQYQSSIPFDQLSQKVVYIDFVDAKTMDVISHHFSLSKQFRFKLSKLPFDLIGYLRLYLRRFLGDIDCYQIPGSYDSQLKLLQFLQSLIHTLTNKLFKATPIITNLFIKRLTQNYKTILQTQLKMISQCIIIINKLKSNIDHKVIIDSISQQSFSNIGQYVQDIIKYGFN